MSAIWTPSVIQCWVPWQKVAGIRAAPSSRVAPGAVIMCTGNGGLRGNTDRYYANIQWLKYQSVTGVTHGNGPTKVITRNMHYSRLNIYQRSHGEDVRRCQHPDLRDAQEGVWFSRVLKEHSLFSRFALQKDGSEKKMSHSFKKRGKIKKILLSVYVWSTSKFTAASQFQPLLHRHRHK